MRTTFRIRGPGLVLAVNCALAAPLLGQTRPAPAVPGAAYFDDGMSVHFIDVTARCWKAPNQSGVRSCDAGRPVTIAVDSAQTLALSAVRQIELVSFDLGHGWQNGAMGFLETAELRVTTRTGVVATVRLHGLVSYTFRVRDDRTGQTRDVEYPWVLVNQDKPAVNLMRITFAGT